MKPKADAEPQLSTEVPADIQFYDMVVPDEYFEPAPTTALTQEVDTIVNAAGYEGYILLEYDQNGKFTRIAVSANIHDAGIDPNYLDQTTKLTDCTRSNGCNGKPTGAGVFVCVGECVVDVVADWWDSVDFDL